MHYNTLVILMFLFSLLTVGTASAKQPLELLADGEYVMGAGETMEVAEERARMAAMRSAAEQAGIFVKSYTKVRNQQLEDDVIEVIARHAMRVEVLERKKTVLGDVEAIRFQVRIRVLIAEEDIQYNLKKITQEQVAVNAYMRLKQEYERQSAEMEQLKKRLVQASGVDKLKVAGQISAEETKFKAMLWLDKARKMPPQEALDAYKKALSLNPRLAQAYAGMAELLYYRNMSIADDIRTMTSQYQELTKALGYLDKALAIEQAYGDVYAMRVDLLEAMLDRQRRIFEAEGKTSQVAGLEKQYHERIMGDINRAIALNAAKKPEMYMRRAYHHLNRAAAEPYSSASRDRMVSGFDRALADIGHAIELCKSSDFDCLIRFHNAKAGIYGTIKGRYIQAGASAQADEAGRQLKICNSTVAELVRRQRLQDQIQEAEARQVELQSELARLWNELDFGWRSRALGNLAKNGQRDSDEARESFRRRVSAVRQRVSDGAASAEDHLLLATLAYDDNSAARRGNFQKGIELLEKRKPVGREALLLMKFYHDSAEFDAEQKRYDDALGLLDKAQKIIEKYLYQENRISQLGLFQQISGKGMNPSTLKLDRHTAESLFWISYALQFKRMGANIYEKLGLPARASQEYRYLCEKLKDQESCKDLKRLN